VPLFAQQKERCGTILPTWVRSSYKPNGKVFEQWMKGNSVGRVATDDSTIYIIPVVVHVLHNGEAIGTGNNVSISQIQSQIQVLNEDYRRMTNTNGFNSSSVGADAKIEFRLANRNPQGIESDGIVRVRATRTAYTFTNNETIKNTSRWPTDRYLNIWVCNLTDLLGYAQWPITDIEGIPQDPLDSLLDGLVVTTEAFGLTGVPNYAYNLGRTATHEIGHYLGLLHLWGDGFDCTSTDYCEDTPTQSGSLQNCPVRRNSCPTLNNGDMIPNYMNYTDDRCMNIFTINQVGRMRHVLALSPRRRTLMTGGGYVLDSSKPKSVTDFTIFPNPARQNLIVQTSHNINKVNLVSALGQQMNVLPLEIEIGKYNLDITFVASGIYILQAETDIGIINRRIVISKD